MDSKTRRLAISEEITVHLRMLKAISAFVVVALVALVSLAAYYPDQNPLRELPRAYAFALIGFILILGASSIYVNRLITRRAVRSIEDYGGRLDTLLEVTMEIRNEIYGDLLLEKIMDRSLALTSSEAGSILLLDGGELQFRIVKGIAKEKLINMKIPKDTGITGHALRESSAFYINDVKKDARFNDTVDRLSGFSTRSMLCAPLITGNGTIGVIDVLNKSGGPYDEKDAEIIGYLASQAAISLERAQFYEDHRNYEIHLTDMLLDAMDRHLPEKAGHARRVAKYANMLARGLGLGEERRKTLFTAALLHDLGLMRIDSEDSFSLESYKEHPETGYVMLKRINIYESLSPMVRHHHERWDGGGYPDGLANEDIPLESRIIAIVEAFDTMANEPSYKLVIGQEAALEELKNSSGYQFDPKLVTLFVSSMEKFSEKGRKEHLS